MDSESSKGLPRGQQGTRTIQYARGIKKDHPFCVHCKRPGHTIEKCYKIHGFPRGFKTNQRVNNVTVDDRKNYQTEGELTEMFQSFSSAQCQKLISALSGQIASVNMASTSNNGPKGIYYSMSFLSNPHISQVWILLRSHTTHM